MRLEATGNQGSSEVRICCSSMLNVLLTMHRWTFRTIERSSNPFTVTMSSGTGAFYASFATTHELHTRTATRSRASCTPNKLSALA